MQNKIVLFIMKAFEQQSINYVIDLCHPVDVGDEVLSYKTCSFLYEVDLDYLTILDVTATEMFIRHGYCLYNTCYVN